MISPAVYREALGHLPTGVTIVTADNDCPVGLAANSVTSVSLEPPMVLLCPAKSSATWPSIRATGRFCINVMGGHHEELCRRFSLKGCDRFADVAWHARRGGPGLDEAVAWIDCAIHAEHDAGDHTIVVGEVLEVETAPEAVPLVYFRGRYGTFQAHGTLTPDRDA